MKRHLRIAVALTLWLVSSAGAVESRPAPAQKGAPPRKLNSAGVYLRSVGPDGQVRYRYVYRGYENGFVPPAWMYYGYPHSPNLPSGLGF